jgi:hypothetical protein
MQRISNEAVRIVGAVVGGAFVVGQRSVPRRIMAAKVK